MAKKTRNERRKLARQQALAKAVRIANANEATLRTKVRKIVVENMSRPIERNYYVGTCSSVYSGHNAARASGLGVTYHSKP